MYKDSKKKDSKKKDSKKKDSKKKNSKIKIPLKKIEYSKSQKYKYHIQDSDYKRHRALNEYIKSKKDMIKAAKDKKARLNVLRIYRKNKDKESCRIITSDMIYIDNKYLKKFNKTKTNKIC